MVAQRQAIVDLTSVHPKIRAVASERKENVGVRNALKFQNCQTAYFHYGCIRGSNYLGQQFIEYLKDEWPRNLFADHQRFRLLFKTKSTFHCLPTAKKPKRLH